MGIPQKTNEKENKLRKLTQRSVESIDFEPKNKDPKKSNVKFYFDSELKGFGLRVTHTTKTYIVQGWVNGEKVRIKIGRDDEFKAERARNEAKDIIGQMARGINPSKLKKETNAAAITLSQIWDEYKNARELRPASIKVYAGALTRCFPDWLDKPVVAISKDMVEARCIELRNWKGPRSKPDGAKALAHQAMRVLRSLLNFAAAKYERADGTSIIPENPVKRLSQAKLWPAVTRRQSIIHEEQLKPWFEAVMALENDVIRDYLIVCLLTGLRRTEAATLKFTDLDLDVTKKLTIKGDKTKNHDDHELPLSDYLIELFKAEGL